VTTPAPTPPPVLVIPSATLNSHFGFCDASFDYQELSDLGIRWDRATSDKPFSWYLIEKEKGKFDWSGVDKYVQESQKYSFSILATIWPFTAWDQANWGPSTSTTRYANISQLGNSRRKPYSMDAYMNFVSALVERYDGDCKNDMPGLKYPIKYWEASNEPDMISFDGTPQDYLEVLEATYKAVKRADSEAKVVQAAVGQLERSFTRPILEKGAEYFDIANVHSISNSVYLWVPEYKELLSSYGINKPLWVTESEYRIGQSILSPSSDLTVEEQGQFLAKGYVTAFAYGADKILYNWFRAPSTVNERWSPTVTAQFQRAALIDEKGVERPAYHALVTMMKKLELFTAAKKLSEGRFQFTVGGKTVYVMWGSGALPAEVAGELTVTDIYGTETKINSSALNLTHNLVFVEIASGTR
jgi:hypothetical protein